MPGLRGWTTASLGSSSWGARGPGSSSRRKSSLRRRPAGSWAPSTCSFSRLTAASRLPSRPALTRAVRRRAPSSATSASVFALMRTTFFALSAVVLVMRGDRESRAHPGARRPRAGRGEIEQDFVFHGILTANKLSKFRENAPGRGAARTIRAERARPGAHQHPRASISTRGRAPARAGRRERGERD
jgi:hypothetical protein